MLVVLTNYYYPETGGCSARITELTRELSGKVKITVLCPVPSYPFNKVLGNYTQRYTCEKVNDNLEVVRINVPLYSTNSLKGRVFSEIILVLCALKYFYLNLRKDCDRVITTSPPFFINFFGLVCKKIFRKEWIQDIRDLWPDSIIGTGVAKENSITIKILRLLEKFFYKSATKVVAVTGGMAGHIKFNLPENKQEKVYIVPNGYSQKMKEYALQRKNYVRGSGKNNKVKVGYVGNLGRAQDLELLAYVIKQVFHKKLEPGIEFLIVGEGPGKEWLKKELSSINIVEVLDGTTDKDRVADYYTEIDVFIIPLKDHPVFETVIPSKVYELILFEKPFIHFTSGELQKIGEESGLGLYLGREEINNIDHKLTNIKNLKVKDYSTAESWKDLSSLYFSILAPLEAYCG